MKITLTKKESEKFFHSAMCNGMDYVESGYGLELSYKKADYLKAKTSLDTKFANGEIPHFIHYPDWQKEKGEKPEICREDVWMEILVTGGKLKLIDHENSGTYTQEISLKDVHDRVQKTPLNHLTDMIEENDDAVTADVIIQQVFLNEVVFG